MRKINYLDITGLLQFQGFIDDNPHNNGMAWWYTIEDPDGSAYPEVDIYLIGCSLNIGDNILLHSQW